MSRAVRRFYSSCCNRQMQELCNGHVAAGAPPASSRGLSCAPMFRRGGRTWRRWWSAANSHAAASIPRRRACQLLTPAALHPASVIAGRAAGLEGCPGLTSKPATATRAWCWGPCSGTRAGRRPLAAHTTLLPRARAAGAVPACASSGKRARPSCELAVASARRRARHAFSLTLRACGGSSSGRHNGGGPARNLGAVVSQAWGEARGASISPAAVRPWRHQRANSALKSRHRSLREARFPAHCTCRCCQRLGGRACAVRAMAAADQMGAREDHRGAAACCQPL
jgi:hypothetical protein